MMARILLFAVAAAWLIERTRPGARSWRRLAGSTVFVLAGGLVFALVAAVAP
jgi:hypothetical protein